MHVLECVVHKVFLGYEECGLAVNVDFGGYLRRMWLQEGIIQPDEVYREIFLQKHNEIHDLMHLGGGWYKCPFWHDIWHYYLRFGFGRYILTDHW